MLQEFPFKGAEQSLKALEEHELVSVSYIDGRASMVKPGKPVFRYVFQALVNGTLHRALGSRKASQTGCREDELMTNLLFCRSRFQIIMSNRVQQRHHRQIRVRYQSIRTRTDESQKHHNGGWVRRSWSFGRMAGFGWEQCD